jgi:uncharacterized protein (TIRG00374 family)
LVLVAIIGGAVAVVTVLALARLGAGVNVHALLAVRIGWWWLVLAAAVNLVSILAKGAVWKAVLEPVCGARRVRWRAVVSAMFIGFLVNTVLAARVGEVARAAVLKRRLRLEGVDVEFATIAGTVVAEQVTLGIALILFIGAAALLVPLPAWVAGGVVAVIVMLALVGGALGAAAWSSRHRDKLAPRTGSRRFTRALDALMAGQAVFGRARLAAVALGASLVSWIAQVLAISLTLDAFGIRGGLAAAALVFVATTLAGLFPILPASIGVFQGAVSVALVSAYGVAPAVALAFSVALQLVEMVFGVGLGVVFLAAEGLSLSSTRALIASERR